MTSNVEPPGGGGVAVPGTTTPFDPQGPTASGAGNVMRAEIHQQPSRWATFLREAPGSLAAARALVDSGPRFVLFVARGTSEVDLAEVDFMDAAEFRGLLRGTKQWRSRGGTLVLTGAHGLVRRVIEICGGGSRGDVVLG